MRERKPTTPEKTLEHILTYFRTRGLNEQAWESKENFTTKRHGAKQVTSPSHSHPFTRRDLIEQQKADESLQLLFLEARRESSEYAVRDEVLYGLNLQPKADKNAYKIVVPTPLREELLRLGHDKSGHFGHKKTKDHIRREPS